MIEEVINSLTGGIPAPIVMGLPFIVGLILGFLIKKLLKIALALIIAAGVGVYLGFITINLDALRDAAAKYGDAATVAASMLLSIVPMGAGLIIGFILGLKYG